MRTRRSPSCSATAANAACRSPSPTTTPAAAAAPLRWRSILLQHAERQPFKPLYDWQQPSDQVAAVARAMYGARGVVAKPAQRDLKDIHRLGYDGLPICIAKTQNSLSDDPARRGRPTDFDVTVRGIQINAGAGFLVVLTGDIMRMPGLPKKPLAEALDLAGDAIVGLA